MRQRILLGLRDVKIGEYVTVLPLRSEAEAQRFFLDSLNNPQSQMAKYPRDYQIHILASFDPESGAVSPEAAPRDITPYSGVEEVTNRAAK